MLSSAPTPGFSPTLQGGAGQGRAAAVCSERQDDRGDLLGIEVFHLALDELTLVVGVIAGL